MAATTFNRLMESDPCLGQALTSLGTGIVVVNSNAKAANDKDPWACLDGTGTNHANVRPVVPSRKSSYIELYMAGRAAGAAITTALKMRCYGLVPPGKKDVGANGDIWPFNVDTGFTDVDQMFVPLVAQDGDSEVTFRTAYDMQYGSAWGVIGPFHFHIGGCKLIVPMVSQAVAGPAAALVLARFVS